MELSAAAMLSIFGMSCAGGTLKAGEYRFEQPATLPAVYNRIVRGDVYTRTVTIPEGFNLFDIAQAVQDAQLGSKESFLAAANQDVALIADLDPGAKNLEGYLFPDTYRFQRHQPPSQLLAAMVRRFRQSSASIGIGGDYHRIVTLASLVEKETPVAEDRPLVASVLENRLAKDMPLMTDPTVIYAAMLEKQYRGTIYQSDLKRDSAYNTYRHTGLPPGPICSPGIASLQAAMHPADSNFLYFVADAGRLGPLPVCHNARRARAQCKRLPAGAQRCRGDPLKSSPSHAWPRALTWRLLYTRIS